MATAHQCQNTDIELCTVTAVTMATVHAPGYPGLEIRTAYLAVFARNDVTAVLMTLVPVVFAEKLSQVFRNQSF